MFTPEFIRENTTRLGRGSVYQTNGEVNEGIELFYGSNTSMLFGLRKFAALDPADAREDVILYPVVNVLRVEITSQD